jgi:hypothetical protein
MALTVSPFGNQTVVVPAGSSIAVFTNGTANVSRVGSFANYPDQAALLGQVVNTQTVFGSFTTQANIVVEAVAGLPVYYEIGTAPAVAQNRLNWQVQPTPATLNATGALTYALMNQGIVTSTTAAAVTGTLPTGSVLDGSSTFAINDSVDWIVINTGATNAFTVSAATGHTIVGSATVALSSSGRFRTVKTAAATFVTYRLS